MSIFWKRRNWARAAGVAAAIVLMGPTAERPACAQGGVVFCANCGSEYTQWLNYLQLVGQLEKQAGLLRYAIKNTAALSSFTRNDSIADIRAFTDILKQGQALSFASANIDAQFALKFKDYNGYAALKLDGQTMAAKYQQWSADANAATKTTLKAAGAQSQQMEGAEEAPDPGAGGEGADDGGRARGAADSPRARRRNGAPAAEAAPARAAQHGSRGQARTDRGRPARRRTGGVAKVHESAGAT